MGIKVKAKTILLCLFFVFSFAFFTFTAGVALAVSPPADVDYGLAADEQQGGGCLVGETIRIFNGNNIQFREDLRFASPNRLAFLFQAAYNSRSDILGSLGYGWIHTYESSLDPSFDIEGVTYIKVIDNTGRASYFLEETAGVYKGAFKERSYVKAEGGGYIWYRLDGSRLMFSSSGLLTWIEDEKSNRLELAYSDNKLQTVTDTATGRILTFHYNGDGRLESISGPVTAAVPSGIWITYGYDGNQNLISVTYSDGSGFSYTYSDPNNIHNLTEKRDKSNHLLNTYAYDDQDRVIDNFSVLGKGVSINYVSETQVDVTDAYAVPRTYTMGDIDGRKRVTADSGPAIAPYSDSNAVRWVYDAMMRLIEVEYGGGAIYQYQDYDDRGNPGTVRLAVGAPEEKVITHTFHPEMNVRLSSTEASVLGGSNKVTIWDYDNDYDAAPNESPTRLLSRIVEQGFTKNLSGDVISYEYITTFTYNSKGQILTIDGPLAGGDDTSTFAYDTTTGDLLNIARPLIGTTTFSNYDPAGKLGRVTDVNGQSKNFSYDGRGRITTIINDADGSTTVFNYNMAGQLDSVIDADGITSAFTYDTQYGRLTKLIDPEGNYISYGYDTQGNRTELSYHDPSDNRTYRKRYSYQQPDLPGRLWKIINPDNTYTEYGYDNAGNIISVTDPMTHITTYTYDSLNRLVTAIQPGDITTSYSYNSQDKLSTVIDAEGNQTTYLYDDMGRVISATSPDTGTVSYVYDKGGNLISKTDAKGITVTYTYDPLNRLAAIYFPDSSQNITRFYDQGTNGKGRLTGMTDPSGSMVNRYDALGRLIRDTRTIAGRNFITEYTYSAVGRLTGIIYPGGREVTYNRNSLGKIAGVTSAYDGDTSTLVSNLTYVPFGPSAGMDVGSGSGINNIFDELYRMLTANPGAESERTYSYDGNSNIISINVTNNPDKDQTFTYDSLNRLLTAANIYDSGYTYDRVGNRLTRTIDDQTETYTYITGSNKLLEVTGPNPMTFTYDANGNTAAIGDKTLTYNQNNRLISVTENGNTLGEYTYNGHGQRVKKVAGSETTLFIYDKDGNLIAEADKYGQTLREYVYLAGNILAQFAYEIPEKIDVTVSTSKGKLLSNINVYAFTESGTYTGLHAVTDDQGVALFDIADFTEGDYKFRADYLSAQFWSPVISLPGIYTTDVLIEEETAEVTVTAAGEEKEGINVYLFNESGSYLGLYQVTDSEGKVYFDLPVGQSFQFRADHMSNQYWSDTTVIGSGGTTYVDIDTGGGILTVTIQKDADNPITGINVYLFNSSGSYLGYSEATDENGRVSYQVSGGDYKIRADYLGYQFWSDVIGVYDNTSSILDIPHQDVPITVQGNYDGDVEHRVDLNVYLFTSAGSYLGKYEVTDAQGRVTFNLPEKDYKVRADYLSAQYWSEVFNWTDETITINEGMAEVFVVNMGIPLDGINVYVFNSSGSYLGIHDVTDFQGKVSFRLPEGDYNFRGDYMGNQYWSGISTIIAHVENPVSISTGGGSFTLTVLKGEDDPLAGINCYLFNESGSYLGEYRVTNDQGEVRFNLADGAYKIRIDYIGYQFWTDIFSVPAISSLARTIAHQDVTVTVIGDYDGNIEPGEGLNVYLFTPAGSYLSQRQTTDEQGQTIFNLPNEDYQVRADYLSQQSWSEVFNWTDETITINEGMAKVHVLQRETPLEGVNVYVFTSSGCYLGIYGETNGDGIVNFRLPAGSYKFRGDYQGSQYWATEPVNAHQVNVINLNTGGGTFTLTVEEETGNPIINTPVYVFTSSGSYLGISGQTDDQGHVSFDLSDGDYKFRADYLGYQFWSNVITVPNTLSDVLTITHQDIVITVNEVYGYDVTPLENITVYVFTSGGSYLGISGQTNEQGQVIFSLPQEDYKVRADYLSGQSWSEVFNWQDVEVDIEHGLADLHVTFNGEDVFDAPVYLFTESGSYLGRYERTDENGHAEFLIPAKSYKFRVDYDGIQYWSNVINVIAHEETDVELPLDLLALNLTNDPGPVRFDGNPPVFKPRKIMVAGLGSLTGILSQTVIAAAPTPEVYYYLNDHLGTPQIITDENGTVVWEAKYKPFGEADVYPRSSVVNNIRLPGQYFDQETGLHYNYFRDYNPRTGRYVEPDLIGLKGGINLYAYCLNDPVNMTDPEGEAAILAYYIIQAAIGGVTGAVAGAVTGITTGGKHKWLATIAGGAAGGVAGFMSGAVFGGTAGGAIGGAFGGAIAGGVTKRLSDPGASNRDMALAGTKGAIIGLITGTIGGKLVTALKTVVEASGAAVQIATAMINMPIGMGLGLIRIDSESEQENFGAEFDQENNFGATYWKSWQYDESWYFKWDPNNPETLTRNSSVTISITGGIPPYTWEVSGTGFTMEENQTMGLSNTLIADGTACGSATITVTDAFDALITGYVRCTTGQWSNKIYGCKLTGSYDTDDATTTPPYHTFIKTEGKYKQFHLVMGKSLWYPCDYSDPPCKHTCVYWGTYPISCLAWGPQEIGCAADHTLRCNEFCYSRNTCFGPYPSGRYPCCGCTPSGGVYYKEWVCE